MQKYKPAQIQEGEQQGKWHYIRIHKRRGEPIGYCSGKPPTTKEEYEEVFGPNSPDDWNEDSIQVERAKRTLKINQKKVQQHGDKFHEDGHDTKEEAVECYTEYCLDFNCAIYSDEPTEMLEYHGADPRHLSEPIEGEDVPADVKARECHYPECQTLVAQPTAIISCCGSAHRYYLCSKHCSHKSIEKFWSAPDTVISH